MSAVSPVSDISTPVLYTREYDTIIITRVPGLYASLYVHARYNNILGMCAGKVRAYTTTSVRVCTRNKIITKKSVSLCRTRSELHLRCVSSSSWPKVCECTSNELYGYVQVAVLEGIRSDT